MKNPFDLNGKVVALTGGGGVLCGALAKGLAEAGAAAAVLDIKEDAAEKVAGEIREAGGKALAVRTDVLDRPSVEAALARVLDELGGVDILINGAGGNSPKATTTDEMSLFDLPLEGVRWVFDLNFIGTFIPTQVFGKHFTGTGEGIILNVSSMAALRPLTRVAAYSAAKAAVTNFTHWLAVHVSQNCSKKIRVNAIAPGFFLTEQNRFLLTDQEGGLTTRGKTIIDHTPMDRFGAPEDLLGTVLWLVSDASRFVHGIVVPVDGGLGMGH